MSDSRLVVFDVDGTLVDSQHHIFAAMQAAFGRSGLRAPERDAALAVVGLSLHEAMSALVAASAGGCGARARRALPRRLITEQRAGGDGVAPLYPGARAALDRLAAEPGTLLGIATGKARRGLDHLLLAHDLGRHFATAQTADRHPSKPHPSMLLAALAETGAGAGRGGR